MEILLEPARIVKEQILSVESGLERKLCQKQSKLSKRNDELLRELQSLMLTAKSTDDSQIIEAGIRKNIIEIEALKNQLCRFSDKLNSLQQKLVDSKHMKVNTLSDIQACKESVLSLKREQSSLIYQNQFWNAKVKQQMLIEQKKNRRRDHLNSNSVSDIKRIYHQKQYRVRSVTADKIRTESTFQGLSQANQIIDFLRRIVQFHKKPQPQKESDISRKEASHSRNRYADLCFELNQKQKGFDDSLITSSFEVFSNIQKAELSKQQFRSLETVEVLKQISHLKDLNCIFQMIRRHFVGWNKKVRPHVKSKAKDIFFSQKSSFHHVLSFDQKPPKLLIKRLNRVRVSD